MKSSRQAQCNIGDGQPKMPMMSHKTDDRQTMFDEIFIRSFLGLSLIKRHAF